METSFLDTFIPRLKNRNIGFYFSMQDIDWDLAGDLSLGGSVLKSRIRIYPKKPLMELEQMHDFETNDICPLFDDFEDHFNFIQASVNHDHLFFGQGFVMEPFLRVLNPGQRVSLNYSHDIIVYPHIDIARSAFLYEYNSGCISLEDFSFY